MLVIAQDTCGQHSLSHFLCAPVLRPFLCTHEFYHLQLGVFTGFSVLDTAVKLKTNDCKKNLKHYCAILHVDNFTNLYLPCSI